MQDLNALQLEETTAIVRAAKIELVRRVQLAAEARRRAELAIAAADSVEQIAALTSVIEACGQVVPAELLSTVVRLETQTATAADFYRLRDMTRLPPLEDVDADDPDA